MTARLLWRAPQPAVAVVIATFGLGLSVAVSWFIFGGTTAFRGPFRVLEESWPLIYGSQALLAAAGTWAFGRAVGALAPARLVLVVGLGWLGELVVLLIAGSLVANEIKGAFAVTA